MAERIPDSRTTFKIDNIWRNSANNLTFKIITPIVLLLAGFGILLYLLVLNLISDFTKKIIMEDLERIGHDVYYICDKNFDDFLRTGMVDDERARRIKRGITVGAIEDFIKVNGLECIIYTDDNEKNKVVYKGNFNVDVSGILKEIDHSSMVKRVKIGKNEYYSYQIEFDLWKWDIVLLKNRNKYFKIIFNVGLVYLITGVLLLIAALALYIYLNSYIIAPIYQIIGPIKKGIAPNYKGILEFEFLSTSIKNMINDLSEKTEWIDTILSSIGALVVVLDTTGRIIMLNKTCEQISGYKTEDEEGNYIWRSFIDKKYSALLEKFFSEFSKREFPISFEAPLITNEGKKINIYWNSTVIVDKSGTNIIVIATGTEITKLKTAERLLRESEEKYRSLVDTMNEGLAVDDADGVFTYVNEKFSKMLGYSPNEIIGQPALKFLDEGNKIIYKQEVQKRKKSIKSLYEITWNGKNGNKIVTTVSPMYLLKNNKYRGSFGVVTDVTRRRRLEEELMNSHKLESIGILAGGIAHDFNNTLTAILGNINLAKIYTDEDNKAFEILLAAEKVVYKAKDLTQQLLTFSKGGAPVKYTSSISDLIEDTVVFALRGSNIKYVFDIQKDLWLAEYDTGQISQVINNVVINAKQAMLHGGEISISASNFVVTKKDSLPLKNGKYIKIIVKDQGSGISKENLFKIFDPYFTTKDDGYGLGLASSYSIIKRHGGYMKADSEIDVGTSIFIYLPSTTKSQVLSDIKSAKTISGSGRVLVVDDHQVVANTTEALLSHAGFEVISVNDGLQAIDIYKNKFNAGKSFDVVILDLTIPGELGGKEIFRKLKKIDSFVKAIITSGYSNDDVMANYKKYGFKGVIIKPYKAEELYGLLNQIINEK